MKLCFSCIAWLPAEEPAAADLLAASGFAGVELAPARVGQPAAVRAFWESRGLPVIAMQALLYGHPELRIFDESRPRTFAHLADVIRLGGALGARALVFGAPLNRARGAMAMEDAWPIAVEFFGELGELARAEGTCLCIEPNPAQYGADFCTTSAQALALVDDVASPGFGLHLDSACARLAGENFPARIEASARALRHLHLSEPQLAPLGPGGTADIPAISRALNAIDYQGFVSVEMKSAPEGGNVERVERAIAHVRSAG